MKFGLRKSVITLTTIALFSTLLAIGPIESASAGAGTSTLFVGEQLVQGQVLQSPNGKNILGLQGDGNLVIYWNGKAAWCTCNGVGTRLVMQGDGNLVLYSATNVALWNSGTFQPGSRAILGDDRNLVIVNSGGTPIWSTNTYSLTYNRANSNPMVYGLPTGNGQPTYGYVPSVMIDGAYKMWFCSTPGDTMAFSYSASATGPWTTAAQLTIDGRPFRGTAGFGGNVNQFDYRLVCDPSVIRVNGKYYMYYSGSPYSGVGGAAPQAAPYGSYENNIGLATSDNGINWVHANGGNAVVRNALNRPASLGCGPNPQGQPYEKYGTGQPSALYKDGYFYLMYTDTSGKGAACGAGPGAGAFVIRSTDPTFQTSVQSLVSTGFVADSPSVRSSWPLVPDSKSADWYYSDILDQYVVAINNAQSSTSYRIIPPNLVRSDEKMSLPTATSVDGPALAHRPDGHAPAEPTGGSLERVPLESFYGRQVGSPTVQWAISFVGADFVAGIPGAVLNATNQTKVLEGYRLEVGGLPMTIVQNGVRILFANAAPAQMLSRNVSHPSVSTYNSVPYGATMPNAAQVLGATGRPPAFVLDGNKRWPASCLGLVTANNSSVSYVSAAVWDSSPQGQSLFCLG